jgi:co-chaperonin GroES (HSP10)
MKLATELNQTSIGDKLNYVIQTTIPTITFPIISKGSNWIRVNDVLISETNNRCKVTRKGIFLADFAKRQWAVAYAVAFCQGNFNTCGALKEYSVKFDKCLEEIERYNYHIDIARQNNNSVKEKIVSDRLSRTLSEYTFIIDSISPLIKSQSDV